MCSCLVLGLMEVSARLVVDNHLPLPPLPSTAVPPLFDLEKKKGAREDEKVGGV